MPGKNFHTGKRKKPNPPITQKNEQNPKALMYQGGASKNILPFALRVMDVDSLPLNQNKKLFCFLCLGLIAIAAINGAKASPTIAPKEITYGNATSLTFWQQPPAGYTAVAIPKAPSLTAMPFHTGLQSPSIEISNIRVTKAPIFTFVEKTLGIPANLLIYEQTLSNPMELPPFSSREELIKIIGEKNIAKYMVTQSLLISESMSLHLYQQDKLFITQGLPVPSEITSLKAYANRLIKALYSRDSIPLTQADLMAMIELYESMQSDYLPFQNPLKSDILQLNIRACRDVLTLMISEQREVDMPTYSSRPLMAAYLLAASTEAEEQYTFRP